MRAFTAVFLREIEEHRLVFLIGGFLALISLLAPLLSFTSDSAEDVRQVTAMALALGYALILAVGLGLTGIAAELGSGQQSFYFSRPIGAGSLLGGKLAAAFVLVAGGGLLAATPAATLLAGSVSDSGVRFEPGPGLGITVSTFVVAFAVGAIILVLGFTHFLSLAFRARDAWLAVDLAWLAGLAALGFWSHAQMEAAFASSLWLWILVPTIFLLILAVIVAWLLQVARGRTDLARSHRWMSAVLGCLALAIGGWLAISAHRASQPEPTDVFALDEVQAAAGDWLYLRGMTGLSHRYQPSFFWNTATASYVRVNSARSVTFSEDRSRALWFGRSDPKTYDRDLYWIDLSIPDPLPAKSPATIHGSTRFLSVSPTGSHAALWGGNQLSVIDVASGVPILTRTIEKGPLLGVVFRDPQTLQLLRHERHSTDRKVFVVDTIDLETTSNSAIVTEPLPDHSRFRWFPRGQRLISDMSLIDLATGKRIADLASGASEEKNRLEHRFLSDGRIIGYDFGENSTLLLYDRSGKSLRRFELGPAGYVWIGGQPSRDELFIAIHTGDQTRGNQSRSSWASRVLNLKDGSIRDLISFYSMSRPTDQPGSRSTSLFSDASDSLCERERDGSFTQLTRGGLVWGGGPGMGLPELIF